MDTTKTATHVSLCAGYGGIDLGLKRAIPSLRTIAFSEIEAFACANLVSKMEAGHLDPAPIWTDVKTFPYASFHGKVDILSGGYPCQPFSAAGKRLGAEDPRHLWPFIADGVAAMRPEWCFFENVEGHISLGLPNVIEDLAGMGYRTAWGIFSAAECGAPHQRKRVFILAHRDDYRGEIRYTPRSCGARQAGDALSRGAAMADANGKRGQGPERQLGDACQTGQGRAHSAKDRYACDWPSRPGEPQFGWEPPRVVANAGQSSEGLGNAKNGNSSGDSLHLRPGQAQHRGASGSIDSERGQTEPALGGDVDGRSGGLDYAQLRVACDNRTDELRLLGNGVVPATAERAFTTLLQRLLTYA